MTETSPTSSAKLFIEELKYFLYFAFTFSYFFVILAIYTINQKLKER